MRQIWAEITEWMRGNLRLTVYLAVAAAIVTGATVAFWWQNRQFRAYQQEVIEIQEKEYEHLISLIRLNDSRFQLSVGEFSVADQVAKINADTSRLLEMEMGKLQSEYETLEIWTALITVVFLLFSFFSMFRSEELERQGRETVKRVSEMHTQAQTTVNSIIHDTNADVRQLKADAKTEIDQLRTGLNDFQKSKEEEVKTFMEQEKTDMTASLTTFQGQWDGVFKDCETLYRQSLKTFNEDATVHLEKTDKEITALQGRVNELIQRMEAIIETSEHGGDVAEEEDEPEQAEPDEEETR